MPIRGLPGYWKHSVSTVVASFCGQYQGRPLSSSFCTLSVAMELHLSVCNGAQWKRSRNRLSSHATGGSYPSKGVSSACRVGMRSESSATHPKAATGMWSSLSASHRAAGLIQSQLNYSAAKLPGNARFARLVQPRPLCSQSELPRFGRSRRIEISRLNT